MKIYRRVSWDIETGKVLDADFFEYDGPLALCDRAAQAQAGNAEKTAGTTAAGYGSSASNVNSTLLPALKQDVNNPTGFTPQQLNDMIVSGEQGAGGAASGIAGAAGLNAMRTRNSAALPGVLDQSARQKMQQSSQNNLQVSGENAKLAQAKRSQALSGLEGQYGTDVNAQLKAMGIQNQDIGTEIQAGQSGWLQNTMGVMGQLSNMGLGAAKAAGV
jgi:hypothetical protein